ncbi:pentapeptide repeat-containing protein [Devosia sp. A16]|uniref:pentapeptide repeat-containing protein n=1 Tax=Devosia sp. A16 TaxID=1736675 RepID=UPI0006D7E70B|nr:pentapeptide repeat-containing protein [Devosia sp. A16]
MNPPSLTIADRVLTRDDIAGLAGNDPVRLAGCTLDEARLADLDLTGWVFERCSVARTDFGKTELELAQFLNCRGAFALFNSANLEDAVFRASDFNNASFRSATLSSATFEDCKLTGCDLTEAKSLDVRFTNTLLVSAKLPGFNFRKETLVGVDLSSADLAKCDFREATFENCSLREANIEQARFENADLRGADLGGLSILAQAGRFKGALVSAPQAELILSQTGLKVRAR